jgi:NADP-dependent 3-hydroxy acid dehydrogenase YdfG
VNEVHSKLALITGASKGIGNKTALVLAESGLEIFITARNKVELKSLQEQINSIKGSCSYCAADLNHVNEVDNLIEKIKRKDKLISLMVHAAGVANVGTIKELTIEKWRNTIETNLTAAFFLTQKCIPLMERGSLIIFINSVAGKSIFPEWSAYSASKFGLKAFADTLREELKPEGIRVTTIFPSSVDTSLHDNLPYDWDRSKMLRAEDISNTILHCYKQPSFVCINELDLENFSGTF